MTKQVHALIGAWHLRAMEFQLESGETIHGFGDDPKGFIVYTSTGQMTAQLGNPDRPMIATGDQQKATDQEVRENFEKYIAYYGTYEILEGDKKVLHRVNGSLLRNWEGDVQERFYELEGNLLKLSTPPVSWGDLGTVVTVLTWEKAE